MKVSEVTNKRFSTKAGSQKGQAVINIVNATYEKPSEMVTFQLEHTYNVAVNKIVSKFPAYCKSDWLRDAVREKLERDLKQ